MQLWRQYHQFILKVGVISLLAVFTISVLPSAESACPGGHPACPDAACPNLGCFECTTCSDTMGNFYVSCLNIADIPWCSVNSGSPCLPVPKDPRCSTISPSACGDGVCDATEDCFSCSDDCGTCSGGSVCGNGVVEVSEECDTGASRGACPATCSNSCTTNNCASAVDGVCAAPPHLGTYLTPPPSAARCTIGTPSLVTQAGGFWNWDCLGYSGGDTDHCWATVGTPPPPLPTINLTLNGSDGPLSVASGDVLNFSWTVSNADSCTASEKWSGVKASSDGTHVETGSAIAPSGNYTLTCENSTGTANDSVAVSFSCSASWGPWSACGPPCAGGNGTTERDGIGANCLPTHEEKTCTTTLCRDLNWREVAP